VAFRASARGTSSTNGLVARTSGSSRFARSRSIASVSTGLFRTTEPFRRTPAVPEIPATRGQLTGYAWAGPSRLVRDQPIMIMSLFPEASVRLLYEFGGISLLGGCPAAGAALHGHLRSVITAVVLGVAQPTMLHRVAVALTVAGPPTNLPALGCASTVHVSAVAQVVVVAKLAVTLP
jgi:hypothetical protein